MKALANAFLLLVLLSCQGVFAQKPTVPPPGADCEPSNPTHVSGAEAFKRSKTALHMAAHACWTYVSAVQGFPAGEASWGYMLLNGQGVDESPKEAFHWAKLSAEHGDGIGALNLGLDYQNGTGTAVDLERAKFWLTKAWKDPEARAWMINKAKRDEVDALLKSIVKDAPEPELHYCDLQELKYDRKHCSNVNPWNRPN